MIGKIKYELGVLLASSSNHNVHTLDLILNSHPRLGGKKIESPQSQVEQAQLAAPNEVEGARIAEMNALYEQTFPGLRYVVFVNGRPRSEILRNMKIRIDRSNIKMERVEAIEAMCDIASDRARKSRL